MGKIKIFILVVVSAICLATFQALGSTEAGSLVSQSRLVCGPE